MDKINENYGLTSEQVIESRKKYGENRLTPPKKESVWRLFLEKFMGVGCDKPCHKQRYRGRQNDD